MAAVHISASLVHVLAVGRKTTTLIVVAQFADL